MNVSNPKFQIYMDKAGGFRWRLKAGNGEIVATSGESYKYKAGAVSAVQLIKQLSPSATVEALV